VVVVLAVLPLSAFFPLVAVVVVLAERDWVVLAVHLHLAPVQLVRQ
jgi:hypothetical protein